MQFLFERRKIEKFKKVVANLHGKTEYVEHMGNLKQALICRLHLKKAYRNTKFNQNTWLKRYTYMKTGLRKKQNMTLKKIF